MLCAMEECNEVAQQISKSSRFGLDEVLVGQPLTNRERIVAEFADLCAVLRQLDILQCFQTEEFWDMVDRKDEKIKKYMDYSKEIGIVEDE